jgi:gamma-glutamyltranspeptidase/glutathione hydrolase
VSYKQLSKEAKKHYIQNLKDRGHAVRLGEPWSEGRLCVSTRERDNQGRLILRSAASPRGMQAFAVGR